MKIAGDPIKLEREILSDYFLTYQEYAEIKLLQTNVEDNYCFRCKKELVPLTWIDHNYYYLPCWSCVGNRKADISMIESSILGAIKEFYYEKVLNDRYLQLFLVEDSYFSSTLPHSYSSFKKTVSLLDLPSRNNIWFIDWEPGYPKIISSSNLSGLKITGLDSVYSGPVDISDTEIIVGNYVIKFPEHIPFTHKHYSRYNLINPNSDRVTKRLRVGERCYKFFNTDNRNVKSIFRITDSNSGDEVSIRSLSHQEYSVIKLALLRSKVALKIIFDICTEILKYSVVYRDSVFLKNSVQLCPKSTKKRGTFFNLIWNPVTGTVLDDYINLSVL